MFDAPRSAGSSRGGGRGDRVCEAEKSGRSDGSDKVERAHGVRWRGKRPPARTAGFTLIELLVAIGIIALLIGLLQPGLRKAREGARNAGCLTRLRDLSMNTQMYAASYRCVPVWGTIGAVPVIEMPGVCWWCPADRERRPIEQDASYAYLASLYMGSNVNLLNPSTYNPRLALRLYEENCRLPLYWDFDEFHGHRNVSFWDGCARRWWE
jgi:prepilin-type N-terminal cleavage/methylation domain-containing protein